MIIDGVFISSTSSTSSGDELLGCIADKTSLQLHRQKVASEKDKANVSNTTSSLLWSTHLQLPSDCTALCCGESGVVIVGTANGAIFMVPPIANNPSQPTIPGESSGEKQQNGIEAVVSSSIQLQQLYQHPNTNSKAIDHVAISNDDDTVVATVGLEVVIISPVLLSSVVPVAPATCTHIRKSNDQQRKNTRFSSIHISHNIILLCEDSARGGIVVLQGGKYPCRLAGRYEKDRMSARAFQFVGCGVVMQTNLNDKEMGDASNNNNNMIVVGMESWGGLCIWNVPTRVQEDLSVPVTKEFDIAMRSTVATKFSIHRDYEANDSTVVFAIAYEGACLERKRRVKMQKDDPGWISVFKVPIQSLRAGENKPAQDYVSMDGGIMVFDLGAMQADRGCEGMEQVDLDAFLDRKSISRCHVSFLQFSSSGMLVTGTIGLPWSSLEDDCDDDDAKNHPCVRIFEKQFNASDNPSTRPIAEIAPADAV